MNRVRPSRRRWYSSATGSLTFMTMSDSPHTSSGSSRIVAPCETYSSSVIEEPSPAPFCTNTSWPRRTSSCTPTGVIPTRNSLFLTSLGIPTFTVVALVCLVEHPGTVAAGGCAPVERDASLDPGRVWSDDLEERP